MTAGLRFFYRHIYVTGLENIPSKGPVIIIANHNSSLMDAALLGVLLKRRAWFFARGDVFVNGFVQKIFWWLHMMPVHSHTGGKKTLGANNNSFSDGQKVLSNGGVIVFFPESFSHVEHQLLPFRKGVFRLAFDAAVAHNFSMDIPIVPIGINYDHPVECRTSVQVHAGKPLLLQDYINEYRQNSAAALLHICKDAHLAVSELVLHVQDKNRLEAAGHALTINRNSNTAINTPWKINSSKKLKQELDTCLGINQAEESSFEKRNKDASEYFDLLSAKGLQDKTTTASFSFPAWKKIMLWVGAPFFMIGLLLNGLPVLIARQVADKKVYRKDFYSWIFVACYSFLYFFWLVLLLGLGFYFGWAYAAGLCIIMICTGLFAYVYKEWQRDNNQHKKWQSLSTQEQKELLHLRTILQQPEQSAFTVSPV